MGCQLNHAAQPSIPELVGEPCDPLADEGNIIQNILHDPHIQFFQHKVEQVLLPIRKRKKAIKSSKEIQQFATTDRKEHGKYVESLNKAIKSNTSTITNLLGYMIEEVADVREKDKVSDKFKNEQYSALKCFIYLYTGDYAYKKINSQLRKSDYDKITSVIGVVKQQLESYNKQKFARKLKANAKYGKILDLFRGIPVPDKTMTKGKKLFWKGFSSTSLDRKVANKFGKYLYSIDLNKENPHSYMIVPAELSQFDEEEVVIFPYFFFQCIDTESFTSGAIYSLKQLIPTE